MSLVLQHSPADILARAMIALAMGSDPTEEPLDDWPVYVNSEPKLPDNCLTVYDTSPKYDGRSMIDGETWQHYGIQVRIRATTFEVALLRAEFIRVDLNETLYDETVIIAGTEYLIHCASSTNLLRLGADSPNSKRQLFTVNAALSLKRVN